MLLALAACSEDKPDTPTTGARTIKISVVFDPKVAAPGDTILFTAVVTSSRRTRAISHLQWSADGGTLIETNKRLCAGRRRIRQVRIHLTAKATNDVNSSAAAAYSSEPVKTSTTNAGQVDSSEPVPIHFLRAGDIRSVSTSAATTASRTAQDAAPPVVERSRGRILARWRVGAYQADAVQAGVFGVYSLCLADFLRASSDSIHQRRFAEVLSATPTNPSFSLTAGDRIPAPGGELIMWRRIRFTFISMTGAAEADAGNLRLPVPAVSSHLSTDSKWLVYVQDKSTTERGSVRFADG